MIITSKCKVEGIQNLSPTLKLYEFSIGKALPWEPGLFFYLNIKDDYFKKDWSNVRPFSFASYSAEYPEKPYQVKAKVLIRKKKGYTVRIFSELQIGTEFYIKYSFGNFFLNTRRNKVIIAAGSGISPFLAYFDWIKANDVRNSIIVFHSAKNLSEDLCKIYPSIPSNVRIHQYITQERNITEKNVIYRRIDFEDIIKEVGDERSKYDFYLCGNSEFIHDFKQKIENHGIKRIFYESWD